MEQHSSAIFMHPGSNNIRLLTSKFIKMILELWGNSQIRAMGKFATTAGLFQQCIASAAENLKLPSTRFLEIGNLRSPYYESPIKIMTKPIIYFMPFVYFTKGYRVFMVV